jgi:hypothetical protein
VFEADLEPVLVELMSDAAEKRADRILAQEYDWLQWDPEVRAEVKLLIMREINAGVHEALNPPKPDCYKCEHRCNVPGDCHSACKNWKVNVRGAIHGVRNGWFCWPFDFDPVWLESCDGFEAKVQQQEEIKDA